MMVEKYLIVLLVLAVPLCSQVPSAGASRKATAKSSIASKKPISEPYDLKGDALGMSLDEFRQKHDRANLDYLTGKETGHRAPYCSNDEPDARFFVMEPNRNWGFVSCVLSFPFESGKYAPPGGSLADPDAAYKLFYPTIANVPVSELVYHFYADRLFKITATFDQTSFPTIASALETKYGKPLSAQSKEYQNYFGAHFHGSDQFWTNGITSIALSERGTDLKTSFLLFQHDALSREAEKALPVKKPDL